MKAFIGRTFDEKDEVLVNKIVEFIKSHDIECIDAKPAKSKTVDEKIIELIEGCEIFVGIFTLDKPLCQNEKRTKWFCKPRNKTTTYTTSNWVIQESGFALGKDRKLILLKENGVCELPKLQGNFEYITFDRSSLEKPFLQINQMISDIKGKTSGEDTEKLSVKVTSPDKGMTEEKEGQIKEEVQDEKKKVLDKMWMALLRDENHIEAQRIFDKEVEVILDENDKALTRATLLRYSHPRGDERALEKLQKFAQENNDNPRVIKQLAHRYKEMGEFKEAKNQFLIAADKYDISDANNREGYIDAYVQAASCLADDGDHNSGLNMLKELLSNSDVEELKAKIFEGMARISRDQEIERFFVYAEIALDIDPSNTSLKFDLAYEYRQNGNEKLALLHYRRLTNTIKHIIGQNNMGAAYYNLGCKGKAIRCYINAAKEKETIAMGNLAHSYLEEGFIDDAKKLIVEANKLASEGIDINARVGSAQQKLNDLIQDEDKKEKNILLEATKERKFRVSYSKAFCSEKTIAKAEIEGTWETHWGNGKLTFNEKANSFEIDISIKKVDSLASIMSGLQGEKKEVYKTENHKIKAHVNNLSGKYTIDGKETGTTIMTKGVEYAATGYMVIDEKCNTIEIMEEKKDDKKEFLQWKKIDKSASQEHKAQVKGQD